MIDDYNYIVLEGSDGVGKSSLATGLAEKYGALLTCEPYGFDSFTSQLRKHCLSADDMSIPAREYLLLANRAIGHKEIIRPNLDKGVISDRSFISGMVYANCEGIGFEEWWGAFSAFKDAFVMPDLVIFCRCDKFKPTGGYEDDRYDHRGEEFFIKVQDIFAKALAFLGMRLDLNVVVFDMDFTKTKKQNLERLGNVLTI